MIKKLILVLVFIAFPGSVYSGEEPMEQCDCDDKVLIKGMAITAMNDVNDYLTFYKYEGVSDELKGALKRRIESKLARAALHTYNVESMAAVNNICDAHFSNLSDYDFVADNNLCANEEDSLCFNVQQLSGVCLGRGGKSISINKLRSL